MTHLIALRAGVRLKRNKAAGSVFKYVSIPGKNEIELWPSHNKVANNELEINDQNIQNKSFLLF